MSPNPSSAQRTKINNKINNSSVISLVPYKSPDHTNETHLTLREGFNFTLDSNQVRGVASSFNEEPADFPKDATVAAEQSIDLDTMKTLEKTNIIDVNGDAQQDSFGLAKVASPKTSAPTFKNGSKKIQGGDLLSAYLAEIRRYPLLDPQTELEYAKKYKEQDDEAAGKALVTSNLRLVVKMAFKYHSQWANVLDLIQQGNIGLLQALNKYDPYNPTQTRFSSYAAYWIRSCIYNYIKDNYRMVRLGSTRHGRKLFDNMRKVKESLVTKGITPTTKAISEAMNIPEDEIIIFSQHFSAPALSLDTPLNPEDKRTLEETISSEYDLSPETVAINTQISTRISEKISEFGRALTEDRDVAIWTQRLLSETPRSLKELGEMFNVSKERIRQIENRLKLQARTFLSQELGEDYLIGLSI